MTEILVEKAASITAVEIDGGIVRCLKDIFGTRENFDLIHADFLKHEIDNEFHKIVSNLPYYCASEILFKIAEKLNVPEVFIMLQKDMAERIISSPGSKRYGNLTVTLGFYFRPKILFNISRNDFFPKPEVESSFVKLERKEKYPLSDEKEIDLFKRIIKSAFWGRRKTLLNALTESPHLSFEKNEVKKILEEANIPDTQRGEKFRY